MHNGRKSLILAPQEIPDISGYQWGFGCQFVKAYITENELGMGAVLPCMRLILTGKGMGPSVFAIASLLGKEEVMTRYQNKINFFTSLYENKKQVQ